MITKKNTLALILSAFFFCAADAQNPQEDKKRYIEVTGSAEMTITPDQLELEVILAESGKKPRMDDIELSFFEILKQNGIGKETVNVVSSCPGSWNYWWNYKTGQYQSKTFHLTLTSATNFMKLAKDLHIEGVQSTKIITTTHKNMPQFRKQVKIEAMKAAKEKVTYLLESVGEQPGKLLTVTEMPEVQSNPFFYSRQSYTSNSVVFSKSTAGEGIEQVDDIKIRYEVTVKFEIK